MDLRATKHYTSAVDPGAVMHTHLEQRVFHPYYAIRTIVIVFFVVHGHNIHFSLIHLAETIARLV